MTSASSKPFATAPEPKEDRAAVFVVKGEQMLKLTPEDWVDPQNPAARVSGIESKKSGKR